MKRKKIFSFWDCVVIKETPSIYTSIQLRKAYTVENLKVDCANNLAVNNTQLNLKLKYIFSSLYVFSVGGLYIYIWNNIVVWQYENGI